MPISIKAISGVPQIVFWSWIMYLLLQQPTPTFIIYPSFFIPAYYIAVVLILTFSYYSGFRWKKEGLGGR